MRTPEAPRTAKTKKPSEAGRLSAKANGERFAQPRKHPATEGMAMETMAVMVGLSLMKFENVSPETVRKLAGNCETSTPGVAGHNRIQGAERPAAGP